MYRYLSRYLIINIKSKRTSMVGFYYYYYYFRTNNIDFTNIPQERKQSNLYVASANNIRNEKIP